MIDIRHLITILLAALFSAGYGLAIHRAYERDPHTPYTFVYVALGVAGTLIIAGLVIPFAHVALVLGLFAITGLGQVIGAMQRNHQASQHGSAVAAAAIRSALGHQED